MRLHSEPKLYVYRLNGQPSVKKEWYVYVRFRNPETGDWKIQKDRGGINYFKTVRERESAGKDLLLSWKNAVKNGYSPFAKVPEPVKEKEERLIKVLYDFLDLKKSVIKRRSWQSYKYYLDTFKSYLEKSNLEGIKPAQFKSSHALSFCDHILKEKNYSGRTFNNMTMHLRIMFNILVDREIISVNPFKRVKKLPQPSGTHLAFNEKQKKILKEYLEKNDPQLWKFVQFIYYCYIRPIELLRIKVADVRHGQILIGASDAKNKQSLAVEIPDVFLSQIKKMQLENYPQDYYLFSKGLVPGKKSISRNPVSKRHSDVLKRLKIPPLHTLYSWKHTGNCDAYRAGVGVYELMRQNRHHSLDQTLKYMRSLGLVANIEFRTKAPQL